MYTTGEFKDKINQVVEANLLNPDLKGAFIANEMGVNRMYVHRKLKAYYEKNAREYITEKRIEFAKEQLLKTNLSVRLIAQMVNFYDVSHFTKTFKKYTGYTPTEYRKYTD